MNSIGKHIEDGGDLCIFINNDGVVGIMCRKCGHKWVGQLIPHTAAPDLARRIASSFEAKRSVLHEAGFDPSSVIESLEGF